MSIFIDTGVLYAAAARRDAQHSRAVRLLEVAAEKAPFTTDHVVIETWAMLRSRAGWVVAMAFWLGLRETPLRIETVTGSDLDRAQAIAQAWEDQAFDIVDCTSFAIMERVGCEQAATFDRDFLVYRFGPGRRRAFDVLTVRG